MISERTLRALTRDVLTVPLAILGVLLALVIAFAVTHPASPRVAAPTFSVAPLGQEVSRLAPIVVRYKYAPVERDGAAMLSVDPPVAGTFAWLNERTLLYQPSLPGYERGREYTVRIAPQPDADLPDEFVHRFAAAGLLKVAMVIPSEDDEDVVAESPILVQFTRSVAPLTTLAEASKAGPVLVFDPPIGGTGEWVNTAMYRFTPTQPLPPNARYRVRLVAGLSAASDGQLAQPYEWAFTTYGPAVTRITPDDNTVWASPRQPVTIEFNQPIDRRGAEAAFTLRRGTDTPVVGAFSWADDDRRMTFTPVGLALDSRYTAALAAGVPGRSGGASRVGTQANFTTVGAPRLLRTAPSDGERDARAYGVSFAFNNPMDPDSFEGLISITEHRPEEVRTYWNSERTQLSVYTAFRPSTRYTASIAPGGTDRFGAPLGSTSISFTTRAAEATVSLITPNATAATYSASSEPALFFSTMNMDEVTFSLHRLTDAEYQSARTYRGPDRWRPSSPSIRRWNERTAEARQNWLAAWETKLSENGRLSKGKYWVEVTGPGSRPSWGSDLLFAVVDTALVVKTSQDELLVWAVDMDSGQPLSALEVEVVDGQVNGPSTQLTDGQGIARFRIPLIYTYGPGEDKRAQFVQVRDQSRHGVAGVSWGYSGAYPGQAVRQYVGHLFGDRSLYRPGERVELKGVVRIDDDAAYPIPPADTALWLSFSGGRTSIASQRVTVNEFGTFVTSFDLPQNAALGDYSVTLTAAQPGSSTYYDRPIASASFYVAEFRPAEFEVRVRADGVQTAGAVIQAEVDAAYLFGGSVAQAPLTWNVNVSPRVIRGAGAYAGYSFNDIDPYRGSVTSMSRRSDGKGVTDDGGRFRFSVPTGDVPAYIALDYDLSAAINDQSGQALTGSTRVAVYPGDILPAVRTTSYLGTAGVPTSVRFVAMTPSDGFAPNRDVKISVFRREWITTKVQNADGSKTYQSQPTDTLVEEISARTDGRAEGEVQFTPLRAAVYRVVVEATDDRGRTARAATYQWVTSREYASWRVGNSDAFEMVADRDGYAPGDTAEVLVPAPFDNAIGLVTVERGKNIRQFVQRFETNSERLRIPLDDGSMPNVYVSVVLFRPASAADPVERFARSTINLPVSTASKRLNVDISADRAVAQPRDRVRYTVRVTDFTGKGVRSELSVAVVDKAVLLLAEERGPDGMRAFWYERPLGVSTASSLAVSVDRANDTYRSIYGGSKGGDGFAEDGTRKEFKNTAYWEGRITTDANGFATVDVPLPDNVTTWRLQARAIAEGTRVGESVHELLTTKATLARPALPRFARIGDTLSLRTLVRNGTDRDVEATAMIAVRGIELLDATPRAVRVPAGRSTFAEWPAKVVGEDPFDVTFTATTGTGQRDAVQITVPVREARTPEAVATGAAVDDDQALEAVYLPEFAITAGGKLEVALAPTLVAPLHGHISEFRAYIDTERNVAPRLLASIGVQQQGEADVSALVRSDVAALIGWARPGGGWAWCGVCPTDPELSTFVLTALGEARAAGFTVNGDVLSAARSYLKGQLALPTDSAQAPNPNRRAAMLYAIVRSGRGTSEASTVRALFEQYRSQLNSTGRAYLLLAMHEAGARDSMMRSLITDLTSGAIISANGSHWESPVPGTQYTESTLDTTSMVVIALSRVSPRHLALRESVRWLTFTANEPRPYWPLEERARTVHALGAFAGATGERSSTYPYRVSLNGAEIGSGTFGPKMLSFAKRLNLDELKRGAVNVIEFLRSGQFSGRMYYTMTLFYQTPGEQAEALNRGFGISREYSLLDNPGKPLSEARVGEVVRVKITVLTSSEKRQVDVIDPLPAGLEPIDTRLKVVSAAAARQLADELRKSGRDSSAYVAPWHRWYYSPWNSAQLRDDRVELRASTLPRGVHEYIYLARATTPGAFFAPPTIASETNFPENFGRSDSSVFVVTP